MKVSNKDFIGLDCRSLCVPGTVSAATYRSIPIIEPWLLDYLENEHRAARDKQKVTPEETQLLKDTAEMAKHLRYPVDPTKAAPVAFEGDDLTWNQATGDFEAKGKVKITQLDNHRFTGEDVDGNTITQRIHIPGKGHMMQLTPGQTKVLLDGYETNYNYKDRTGTMERAKGQVADSYMSGKRFEFYPDKIIIYDGTADPSAVHSIRTTIFTRRR